ncbi:stalk domain-containing protein [Anaerotignum sp. MB30-C6]|uniref:stalk domain-containing protein n=1 Tax=Anaerotignum sp. MB30-C6 TaxID=3070814 RepID=UPI0027DE0771|nr:stalk domain-containing protein [Anaerotignum sp. MB30-C6]WMI80290.1 stalk domain-containing protein [Anaerotignum sp. MB30-C6]
MKKKILALACIAMMGTTAVPAFASDKIKVFVNGYEVVFQGQQPVIVDGYTLVPVRGALEAMGVQVVWNEKEQSVLLTKGRKEAKLIIGDKNFKGGGGEQLETPAQMIGGSTMIPLRAVVECFDGRVSWNGEERVVSIASHETKDAYSAVTYKKDLKGNDGKILITGTVKYPQLDATVLGDKANIINEKIAATAKGSLESYLTEKKEQVTTEAKELGKDFKTHDFKIGFETPYYDDNLFSYYSSYYTFTGGSHGNSYAKGYTFDLKTGAKKKLTDFVTLEKTTTEESYLKNVIKQDIKKGSSNYFAEAEEILDESGASLGFYLKNKDTLVVFISEAGWVSPYASGIIRVEKNI